MTSSENPQTHLAGGLQACIIDGDDGNTRLRIELNLSDVMEARRALSLPVDIPSPPIAPSPSADAAAAAFPAQTIAPSPFLALIDPQRIINAAASIDRIAHGPSQQMPATPLAVPGSFRGALSSTLHPNGSQNWSEFLTTGYMKTTLAITHTESSLVVPHPDTHLPPTNTITSAGLTPLQLAAIGRCLKTFNMISENINEKTGLNLFNFYVVLVGMSGQVITAGDWTLSQNEAFGPTFLNHKPWNLAPKVSDGIAAQENVLFVDDACIKNASAKIILVLPVQYYAAHDMFDDVTHPRKMRAKAILLNCSAEKKLSQKHWSVMFPGMQAPYFGLGRWWT